MDWSGDDICLDAERLANGRIAALLESKDPNGISDPCVVFLNEQGDFQKRVCLRYTGIQTAKSIRGLPDSGYVIAGKTASNGGDCYLACFDASDSLLWLQTFGGSGDEEPQDIELTDDGHILLAGYTRSYGPAGFNSLLLKYDLAGTLLWSRVFSTNTFDAAFRLLTIGQSYYISCNMNISPTFGNGDLHLMKLDSSGSIVWVNVYGTGGNEHSWNMIRTLDGKIAFPMASTGSSTNKEIVFVKIDTSGTILLSSRLENGSEALDVFDLIQDPDSSFCLAGHTFTSSTLIHSLIVRIDKNGNPLQSKRSNFSVSSEFWRMLPLGPYRYLFFGYGDKQGTAGSKLFVASSDSNLNLSCQNWQNQTLTQGTSGINTTTVNGFNSGVGGSGQSVNGVVATDLNQPDIFDKNKNFSINTLLPGSRVLCEVDSLPLDPGNFQFYLWENGSTQRLFYADTFGTFRLRAYTQACFNVDSIRLIPGIPVPHYLSEDTCGIDSLKLGMNPIFNHEYSWDFAPGNYEGYVNKGGWYSIDIFEPARNCRIRDSILVRLGPNALAIIPDSIQACLKGNVLQLRAMNTFKLSGDEILKNNWLINGDKVDSQLFFHYAAANPGWKQVLLISESKKGCTDSAAFLYHVHDMPQSAVTLSDTQICVNNLPVQVQDVSTLQNGSYSRIWYADGEALSDDQATWSFSTELAGLYPIGLSIESDSGCTDSLQKVIEVFPAPEARIFTPFPEPQCFRGNLFKFYDTSIWNGGSGTYSTNWKTEQIASIFDQGESVGIVFRNTGKGKVNLFLKSDLGCVDSASYEVIILNSPTALLSVTDTLLCEGYGETTLENKSTFSANALSTLHLPGGETQASFSSYTAQYPDSGQYTFKLVVTQDNGCADSVFQTIEVLAKPQFLLVSDTFLPCLNDNKLVVSGYDHRNGLKTMAVHFGDGVAAYQAPYARHYLNIGTYQVMAIAENHYGCQDSQYLNIEIFPSPEASFYVDPTCLGEPSEFVSTSYLDTGRIVSWHWNFGDGNSGSGSPFFHTYNSPGYYSVQHKVISDKGCADSLSEFEIARVRDVIPADFVIDTLRVSYDYDLFRFSGLNEKAVSHEWQFSSGESFYERVIELGIRDSAQLIIYYRTEDSFACISELWDTLHVDFNRLLVIPNAFSPNQDGLNTYFKPVGAKFNTDYHLLILNRWGEIIFETNDPETGWDGTFRGKTCPVDIYVYQIIIDGGKYQYYGTIHLLR